jgi:hypothetical protein
VGVGVGVHGRSQGVRGGRGPGVLRVENRLGLRLNQLFRIASEPV